MGAGRAMMTARWEYRTIRITYDRRKGKDWVVEYREGPPVVGFQAILDAYGSRGWELISLNLESSRAVAGFGEWQIEPRSYRATFRRRVEDQA
jgi:hypothetical protein